MLDRSKADAESLAACARRWAAAAAALRLAGALQPRALQPSGAAHGQFKLGVPKVTRIWGIHELPTAVKILKILYNSLYEAMFPTKMQTIMIRSCQLLFVKAETQVRR